MTRFEEFLESKAIMKSKLAKQLGLSNVTIINHARGKTEISRDTAKKYADFFGMSLKEFMNRFVL